MNVLASQIWQANIELSLLLLAVLIARFLVQKTTRVYNAYLLWVSIPLGLLLTLVVPLFQVDATTLVAGMVPVSMAMQDVILQSSSDLIEIGWTAMLWLFMALILFVRLAYQHWRLRLDLAALTTPLRLPVDSDYPIVGIHKPNFSPAVYGFVRPKIYFPTHLLGELSSHQIQLIIQHEQHHIKQGHLWLNLVWDIAVCVLWFNPLVYVSRQRFRHDQELFCDYLVLNQSNSREQRSYGYALLSTVAATHSVSLLCSWKSFNQLEERIMNINRSTSVSAKLMMASIGALIVAAASLYSVSVAQTTQAERFSHRIETDGTSYVEWEVDNKVIRSENGASYAIEKGKRRSLTKSEQVALSSKLKQSTQDIEGNSLKPSTGDVVNQDVVLNDREEREEIRFEVDADGQERIFWQTNDKQFHQEGDDYFYVDAGGKRPMSKNERAQFDQMKRRVEAELESREHGPDDRRLEREVEIEQRHAADRDQVKVERDLEQQRVAAAKAHERERLQYMQRKATERQQQARLNREQQVQRELARLADAKTKREFEVRRHAARQARETLRLEQAALRQSQRERARLATEDRVNINSKTLNGQAQDLDSSKVY